MATIVILITRICFVLCRLKDSIHTKLHRDDQVFGILLILKPLLLPLWIFLHTHAPEPDVLSTTCECLFDSGIARFCCNQESIS